MKKSEEPTEKFDPNTGKMVPADFNRAIDIQQRANRRRNRGNVERADWSSANPAKLATAIGAVTQHGFAIRLGYTKDGGAFAVGIIGDGEPFTEFIRPNEDIDLYLEGLGLDYGERPVMWLKS